MSEVSDFRVEKQESGHISVLVTGLIKFHAGSDHWNRRFQFNLADFLQVIATSRATVSESNILRSGSDMGKGAAC
jgi:hypothetical protein